LGHLPTLLAVKKNENTLRPICSYAQWNRIPAEGWQARWHRLTGHAPAGFEEPEEPDRLHAVARYSGARNKNLRPRRSKGEK
jgi:hypothetical protein